MEPSEDPTVPKTITIPDLPGSWLQALNTLLLIVTLLVGAWNKLDVSQVKDRQHENSAKIDDVKVAAEEAKTEAAATKEVTRSHTKDVKAKLDAIEKKAESMDKKVSALPAKPKKPEPDEPDK